MSKYEFWLTTDEGSRIALLDDFMSFEGVRTTNGAGQFLMTLKPEFDTSLIHLDRMVQVWRAPSDGRLSLWNVFFIRRWSFVTLGSEEQILIAGPDMMDLLRRRLICYGAGQTQTQKNDQADDMIKAIVDENAVNDTSTPDYGSRDWTGLTIEPNLAAGPTLLKAFAWRRMDQVCADIAQAAREAGTEVFYLLEPTVDGDTIRFRLMTRVNQPGVDLSNVVTFAREFGNMADPSYEEDWSAEQNYIYAAGQGVENLRYTQEVYDATRIGKSWWNRCEGFADARHSEIMNEIREEGRQALERGRPVRRFSARIMETEGTQYMRDWNWGDKVTARYRRMEFPCIVRTVRIWLEESGRETIEARLEWEPWPAKI
jgi:hypothetical protein